MGGGVEFSLGQAAFELVGHLSGDGQRTELGSETQTWKLWPAGGDEARGVWYGQGRMLGEKKAYDVAQRPKGSPALKGKEAYKVD